MLLDGHTSYYQIKEQKANTLPVGMILLADGLGMHIPKGYLYFAMGFSVLVEALNLAVSKRRKRAQMTA